MSKFKISQMLLPSLASLLIVTPLLSSSLRPTYLYFVINLLIIALGAESGLLSSLLSNPDPNPYSDDRKSHVSPTTPPSCPCPDVSASRDNNVITQEKKPNKVVEKCNSEKIAGGGGGLKAAIAKVKKCPSTPSIFFIGGWETQSPEAACKESEREEQVDKEEEEELAGISSQELFTKAEDFIGNFYKQLEMQREESWKKIHGFYEKSF